MKELQYFEDKIKDILEKNEINNLYVFADSILEQEKKYGTEEVIKKYNLNIDELFYLKVYTDALKIGDFDKDVFKEFNLDKLSELEEKSLNEYLKQSIEKHSNLQVHENLKDELNN